MLHLPLESKAGNNSNGTTGTWGLNKALVDPYLLSTTPGYGYISIASSALLKPGASYFPGITAIDSGAVYNGGLAAVYNNGVSSPESIGIRSVRSTPGSIDANGNVTGGAIFGLGSPQPLRSSGYARYARDLNYISGGALFKAAEQNVYRDRSLTDPTVFDFYNNLIDGNNGNEFNKWDAYSLNVSQSFLNNRIAFEGVYDRQSYTSGRTGFFLENPYLAVDINLASTTQRPQYYRSVSDPTVIDLSANTGITTGAKPLYSPSQLNPHAGSVFVSAENSFNNYSNRIDRESARLTATGEFRGSDVAGKDSLFAKIVGVHNLTALVNRDKVDTRNKTWYYAATDRNWTSQPITGSARQITPIVYLSGSLTGNNQSTPAGLGLRPIDSTISPNGSYDLGYFNSTWKGTATPSAPYTSWDGDPSYQQNANPSNYVGWTSKTGYILNADHGDKDNLTTTDSRTKAVTTSKGVTWQAKLFGGTIVPTYGLRQDHLVYSNADSDIVPGSGIAIGSLPYVQRNNVTSTERSWGIVAKLPAAWASRLPGQTKLSVFYNRGNNQQVVTRYNFDGTLLPNPAGQGTDYGVMVNTLNDRLSIKLGKFEIKNKNQTSGNDFFQGVGYLLTAVQTQGLVQATRDFYGNNNLQDFSGTWWQWSHASFDALQGRTNASTATLGQAGNALTDPRTDAYKNNPATIAAVAAYKDFIATADPYFNKAIGQKGVDVAALKAGVAANNGAAVEAAWGGVWGPVAQAYAGINDPDPLSLNTINGAPMVATLDNVSKGYELEINARPTENWNIQVNVSKTDSYTGAVGQKLLDYVADQYERFKGPAGEIRLYYAGLNGTSADNAGNTPRGIYNTLVLPALAAQQASIGLQAPELRPWQATIINNYRFDSGALKDVNVGGAYRYGSPAIVGYHLKSDNSALDPSNPYKDSAQDGIDLWIGYERKLSKGITWKIQLNARDVGKKAGLVPISINPDGTVALQRIRDGMSWRLSNSFLF